MSQAKFQQEHDARVVEAAAHRRAWGVEEARLQRAFDEEAERMERQTELRLELARERAVQETIRQMFELSAAADGVAGAAGGPLPAGGGPSSIHTTTTTTFT